MLLRQPVIVILIATITYNIVMAKIVFTGGGTAGHVMPNIALIEKLGAHDLYYIGCPNSMEEKLIKNNCPSVKFFAINATKLSRGSFFKNLAIPFKLIASRISARKILKEIKPDLIFSKGGYVALPVTMVSGKVPVFLHESDASMGLANRLALKKCSKVLTSFSSLADSIDGALHVGAPLRSGLYKGNKSVVDKLAGFSSGGGRKNLLITGGSLGAKAINDAVWESLSELVKRFNIVHIVGKSGLSDECASLSGAYKNYYPIEFASNIADYFAWADFCLTRGGANALFELVALKIPSLVVPLPKGASRGDQIDNAKYFKDLGCVEILWQDDMLKESDCGHPRPLDKALADLVKNSDKLKSSAANLNNIDGRDKILELIKEQVK